MILPNIWKVIKFHGSSHHQPVNSVNSLPRINRRNPPRHVPQKVEQVEAAGESKLSPSKFSKTIRWTRPQQKEENHGESPSFSVEIMKHHLLYLFLWSIFHSCVK